MLAVSNLQAVRDDRILFEDLSFTLEAGQLLQIAGPNGTGKTTLLHLLVGLAPMTQGEIFWQQQAVVDDLTTFRRAYSFLGHQLGLKALLSPIENLRFMTALRGLHLSEIDIVQALAKVGLVGYEDIPVAHLSAGQKRRVGLARLFLEQSPLWVLDEPFTAIDQRGVQALEGWLLAHAQAGGLVLLTTHHRFPPDFPILQLDLTRFRPRLEA